MGFADLIAALLLPVPPWLGFWIFRRKGRIGLSYGYFLGGILAVLALPWAHLTGFAIPTAQLGGALFGFTLFLQAQREGVQGLRRLVVGVGGATGFLLLLLLRLHLPWQELGRFWAGAILESLLWLLGSDLAYRWARGRHLELRMPMVGAVALGVGALAQGILPATAPRLSWPAALVGGVLLGLVALQQLRWLRNQGAWVEGRGEGLRVALSLLDQKPLEEGPSLSLGLDARQPMWLVDAQGQILESNGPFSRLVGLPRHQLRGYGMDALFQGGENAVWEGMRRQLLQFGCAAVQATQVSRDGTFRPVDLEASAFDRGMAMVWIADSATGAISLRNRGGALSPGGEEDVRHQTVNALLALSSAAHRLRSEVAHPALRPVIDQVTQALLRLHPTLSPGSTHPSLDGRATLEAWLPRLQSLLPPGSSLELEAAALPLAGEAENLRQIATHLVLHGMEGAARGPLTLHLQPVDLGGRCLGLLEVRDGGSGAARVKTVFGLGWLRQAVLEAGGLLELDQDEIHGIRPKVYLPTDATAPGGGSGGSPALASRNIWVVDRDPLALEALLSLVRVAGGDATGFTDLRAMLQTSHGHAVPDLLVLERTPRLDRFHRALRTFQKAPIPTLVLGMGQPLPLNPGSLGLRRLGFLEKPFRPESFLQSLLALLHQPEA